MTTCPLLEKCGFVKTYGEQKKLAVNGFIKMYCHTEKQTECERKKYREVNGCAPPDDMLPNGKFMKHNGEE